MTQPKHVFVLMLENRSFDHMFGFSGLTGVDAASGAQTTIEGLSGTEVNRFNGRTYPVKRSADYALRHDPGHEFLQVLEQLGGEGAHISPAYPVPNNSGFVSSNAGSGGGGDPGKVMECFDTARQLPVLSTLASEFAICDHWFASMPGPTWPNRMFVHAASSAGLDCSPTTKDILMWETLDGFTFPHGNIYNRLAAARRRYRFYSGDDFPMVASLKGITLEDVHRVDGLAAHLQAPFPYDYVFIEPSYNILHDYRNSSSQHPLADIRAGETLVKTVYEAIRNSPIWNDSLLIILWDEHGGFYDHVAPPVAIPPGDTRPRSKHNSYGFTFDRYGGRTPALVISPRIPKATIDHRIYDHASVPKTLEAVFGLPHLTARDEAAASVHTLLSLSTARTDTPSKLPSPAIGPMIMSGLDPQLAGAIIDNAPPVVRAEDPIDCGSLPGFVNVAVRQDLEMNPNGKARILARVAAMNTRSDAMTYLAEVQAKLRARGDA
jgi:phospholipase C